MKLLSAPVTVRLLEPSANLALTELSVTPGLIDAHARELFLYAQCQMLALALHEQTGRPLWAAEQQLRSGEWVHVAVRTPVGQWLDIEGRRGLLAGPRPQVHPPPGRPVPPDVGRGVPGPPRLGRTGHGCRLVRAGRRAGDRRTRSGAAAAAEAAAPPTARRPHLRRRTRQLPVRR